MRRLVVLRPEPGASATVERARELGLEAVSVRLFEIEPLEWEMPEAGGFDGLLVTSANAARHLGTELRILPVYAVGEATADAARELGYAIARVGDSGVDQLLGSIDRDLKLLHLCGTDRREPRKPRQRITSIVVYRSVPVDRPDLGTAGDAVILVHSPRAGRRLAELMGERGSAIIAAISPAAAETVGDGWAAVESAEKPNDDALLALAARLCNKPPPE